MYNSFDGEYRRRPVQNLGGASQNNDRETIIRKAQEERLKRRRLQEQNDKALILQSYARSFIYRQRKKKTEREIYDGLRKQKDFLNDGQLLGTLLQRLVFFYCKQNTSDCDRLIDISQILVKNPSGVIANAATDPIWLYRVKRLLFVCLEQLTIPNVLQALPLRIIETFSAKKSLSKYITSEQLLNRYLVQVFKYIIERKYFKVIREILESKCPPLDGLTIHPPNQLCEALFQMILRPLTLANEKFDYANEICVSFAFNILCPEFSEPIRYFILPSLAEQANFPFAKIIECLSKVAIVLERDEKMQIDDEKENSSHQRITTFALYSLFILDKSNFAQLQNRSVLEGYIKILATVSKNILQLPKNVITTLHTTANTDSSDSESEEEPEQQKLSAIEHECLLEILEKLNSSERVHAIVDNVTEFLQKPDVLYDICRICHSLMIFNRQAIYEYKLIYTLAFRPKFIRTLWYTLTAQSSQMGFSSPISLLSKGVVPKVDVDIDTTIAFLATFCALFGRLVPTLHDGEFCQEDVLPGVSSKIMPFTLSEIIPLSKTLKEISLGLVELAFPETRSNLNEHYRSVLGRSDSDEEDVKQKKQIWANLLKVVVSVLNQIHTRDLRRVFCPEGHWTVQTLNLPLDKASDLPLTRGSRRGPRPFQPIRDFTREDFEKGPPISTKQVRSITILREIPFVVPFSTRVGILQGLVAADKLRVQGEFQGFLQGPSIHLVVRRSHLYEDAFDKLRPENEPDLRHRFRVQFISNLGLDEVGIDGGGVFREFLSELIKTAFDPNRGFFLVTTDNKLYPNPSVGEIIQDFAKHYYFMGRILGKAIYENLLVELPLADFFLSKLAGKHSDVDVHQLASLDPELHRNLLSLKAYEGDVVDLGLDFTVVSNDLGKTKVEELTPNGQTIAVTTSNRIEYIQLMADYKLNKQIRQQCVAFRLGLSDVLPVEWLYMFSNKELQILISGAEIPIDLEDLKRHCRYGGEYSPTHPTIQCFWQVLEGFTDIQKRQLLKFVTSCSRPPLLGFKDLDPPFSIQNAGDEERLPSASTCTNLLKLPSFKSEDQMREKLMYAIQSASGFELS